MSADCAIADEIDITQLDEEKTEKIIFDVLNARQQKNEREVKDEIAKAVAGADVYKRQHQEHTGGQK